MFSAINTHAKNVTSTVVIWGSAAGISPKRAVNAQLATRVGKGAVVFLT